MATSKSTGGRYSSSFRGTTRSLSTRDGRHWPSLFQVDAASFVEGLGNAAAERRAQQRESIVEVREAVSLDLVLVQPDRWQRRVLESPAVEQEAHTTGPLRLRPAEVDADEPAAAHDEPAFLACLPAARVPG